MSHERLTQIIQAHQKAIDTDPEHSFTHEAILSIFMAIDKGEVTVGQALRLVRYQAQRLADEPAWAALYRQAAADLQQMQREEH